MGTEITNFIQKGSWIAGTAAECKVEAKNRFLIERPFVAFGSLLERRVNILWNIFKGDCRHSETITDAKRMSIQKRDVVVSIIMRQWISLPTRPVFPWSSLELGNMPGPRHETACRKPRRLEESKAMRVDILTLFPGICEGALAESMMKRARDKGLASIHVHNIRDWARDKHHVTDDAPYGGGQGMVMKVEPIFEAVESLRQQGTRVVLMSPAGRRFSHAIAKEFSAVSHLILVCGHYEGVDARVAEHVADDEISIGDYVLTNGAVAALVFTDAVVRLIPGVLGDEDSAAQDSFSGGALEFPHYTRPVEYKGWRVPEILLSGNHAAIAEWRRQRSLEKTQKTRPDLLA